VRGAHPHVGVRGEERLEAFDADVGAVLEHRRRPGVEHDRRVAGGDDLVGRVEPRVVGREPLNRELELQAARAGVEGVGDDGPRIVVGGVDRGERDRAVGRRGGVDHPLVEVGGRPRTRGVRERGVPLDARVGQRRLHPLAVGRVVERPAGVVAERLPDGGHQALGHQVDVGVHDAVDGELSHR
jgi:hypothetical protein